MYDSFVFYKVEGMRTPVPIPINPGGVLAAEHVVGRKDDLARVMSVLETRSVVITGERRMGKTSLATLVETEAERRGWTVVRQSAEGKATLDALATSLEISFERRHGKLRRLKRAVRAGTAINAGPVTYAHNSGSDSLEEVVEAAVEQADGKLLLVLDELPLFARALNRSTPGSQDGTAALHLLRHLRQTCPDLRMLCLGSIGFHHVIRDASGVLNDTERVRLHPLSTSGEDSDAQYLARCLMLSAPDLVIGDPVAVADAIATEVQGMPYYVHKVMSAATEPGRERRFGPDDVREIVADALSAIADDPWDLRHYRDRVRRYYDEDAPLAYAALDALAAAAEPQSLTDLQRLLDTNPALAPVDADRLRDVLERLEDDHYLIRHDGCRTFAFDLIRRAWTELRR